MREGEGYRHKTIDYLCRNWNYILRIIYLVPGPSRGLDCSRGTLITCLPQPGGQSVYGERFHVGSLEIVPVRVRECSWMEGYQSTETLNVVNVVFLRWCSHSMLSCKPYCNSVHGNNLF